jgi:hypothetical protein
MFSVLFTTPFVVKAQVDSLTNKKEVTDCEASLSLATAEFNAGRFFSLPSILENCLDKGFTKEQRVRAYILLCQVYLINDNPTEAEASYLKLLNADPEYVAKSEIDPIDVVFLSQKFTTRPVFTPHFKGGINVSNVSLIHDQGTSRDSVSSSYKIKAGWTFGGGIDWNLSDRISLSLDAMLTNRSFQKDDSKIFGGDQRMLVTKLTWIDLPLMIKYQDYIGAFRPYGYLGYSVHFNLSGTEQLSYTNIESPTDEGQGSQYETAGKDIVFTDRLSFFNRSFVLGGGIKYKVGKNYLFADLRVHVGLSNVTDASKNISFQDEETWKYGFVNDLYRVNSLNLTVGYIFPVYNPRKKGGWEPKGFLGKILYGNKEVAK